MISESINYFCVQKYFEPNIKEKNRKNLRPPLKNIRCPHIDYPSNFRIHCCASAGEICIARTIVRRAAIISKNDPLRTLSVLTSPSLEDFPVLALLESARVVLGSSKVPFEFWGAHPELRSETRFGDESIENLRLEV